MTIVEELEKVLQVIDKDRVNCHVAMPGQQVVAVKVHFHVHVNINQEGERDV